MDCWLLPLFAGRFRLFAPRAFARGRGLAGAANESASPAGRSVDMLQGRQKVDAQATIGLRPLYRPPVADLQWVLSPHNHCAPRRRFGQEPLRKSPVSPCSAWLTPGRNMLLHRSFFFFFFFYYYSLPCSLISGATLCHHPVPSRCQLFVKADPRLYAKPTIQMHNISFLYRNSCNHIETFSLVLNLVPAISKSSNTGQP